MFQFFSKTYQHRVTYKNSMTVVKDAVKSFASNSNVIDHFYDNERNEGFYKGKSFYITYELHQTNEGIIVELTTSCKLPFFVPRTYTNGFIEFLNNTI